MDNNLTPNEPNTASEPVAPDEPDVANQPTNSVPVADAHTAGLAYSDGTPLLSPGTAQQVPPPPPNATGMLPAYDYHGNYGYNYRTVPPLQTPLPLVALILGLCGFIFSLPCSIAAIIVGAVGRKKAKELNQPTGMATAGMVLGIVLTILWTLYFIFFFFLLIFAAAFSTDSNSTSAGREVANATMAVNSYYVDNGGYEGVSVQKLNRYGYSPTSSKYTTELMYYNPTHVCIQTEYNGSWAHKASIAGMPLETTSAQPNWDYGKCASPSNDCDQTMRACDDSSSTGTKILWDNKWRTSTVEIRYSSLTV